MRERHQQETRERDACEHRPGLIDAKRQRRLFDHRTDESDRGIVWRSWRPVEEQRRIEPDRLGRAEITRQEARAKILGMDAAPAIEDGIDQGDADSAAEISHQVEQAAGVGDFGLRQRAQRKARRRQQAEHDGDAAHDLRPQHLVEVGRARLERTQAEPERKQREAGGRQDARADSHFEHRGKRRGDKLRASGDEHDGADLERVVAAYEREKHRHQIDRAEQADAEAKAQGAADREGAPS